MAGALLMACLVVLGPALADAAADAAGPGVLACTPWSGDLCTASVAAPGVYDVKVNADGGGGMQAPVHYMNGIFSLDMQLPAGNTGGVNFAWYVMDTISPDNKSPLHSEIDMEFYGNTTSDTVMLALNVFCNGKQNLAQFRLPFDPSAALHTYTVRWGPTQIAWIVDGVPLRILNRAPGQPWPMHAMQPMSSVWATPWTALKADFTAGPITAQYGNYRAAGCLVTQDAVQPAGIQCAGPWNAPIAETPAYTKLHDGALIVDYGWDNA